MKIRLQKEKSGTQHDSVYFFHSHYSVSKHTQNEWIIYIDDYRYYMDMMRILIRLDFFNFISLWLNVI